MRFTVKLGGSLLEDPSTRSDILADVAGLQAEGHEIVLVHGGGKSLTRRLGQLGITSRFVGGLRVTDSATLEVALMVLAGEVGKGLVLELGRLGIAAVGICGADARSVRCVAFQPDGETEPVGQVGRAVAINRDFFDLLLGSGAVPVVSSLALGDDHQLYNVNADQVASVCAWGTGSAALVYLTDVPGVRGSDGAILRCLDRGAIAGLRREGVVSGGMLPKTGSALEALERGVAEVYILPGASPGVLRHFMAGQREEGTLIHAH